MKLILKLIVSAQKKPQLTELNELRWTRDAAFSKLICVVSRPVLGNLEIQTKWEKSFLRSQQWSDTFIHWTPLKNKSIFIPLELSPNILTLSEPWSRERNFNLSNPLKPFCRLRIYNIWEMTMKSSCCGGVAADNKWFMQEREVNIMFADPWK